MRGSESRAKGQGPEAVSPVLNRLLNGSRRRLPEKTVGQDGGCTVTGKGYRNIRLCYCSRALPKVTPSKGVIWVVPRVIPRP